MLDTPNDRLDPAADPPDDQPGGAQISSGGVPKPTADPPDDQPGGKS